MHGWATKEITPQECARMMWTPTGRRFDGAGAMHPAGL
jgi:hypothetical protein